MVACIVGDTTTIATDTCIRPSMVDLGLFARIIGNRPVQHDSAPFFVHVNRRWARETSSSETEANSFPYRNIIARKFLPYFASVVVSVKSGFISLCAF